MKHLDIRDTLVFAQGREFEQEVARQMKLRGYGVMRCYELDGGQNKAPMLEGPYQGLRLPDLQVSVLGKSDWRECKAKTEPSWTRITSQYEHGIGLRCYRDYLAVQEISGLPVYLMIGEHRTGEILIQSLDKLGSPRTYEGPEMDLGGMAFWPRDHFDKWGEYDTAPGQLSMFPTTAGKRWLKIHYAPEHRWGVIRSKDKSEGADR